MQIKFKKLNARAVAPTRKHLGDAGWDLTATSCAFDADGNIVYGTGIAVEIPLGYVGLVFPRSSVAGQNIILTNCVGVIDSGYRGEIMAKFKPLNVVNVKRYAEGERVAQLVIMPIPDVDFTEVDELTASERGAGGYGSTGK